jgi:hypothetical protein
VAYCKNRKADMIGAAALSKKYNDWSGERELSPNPAFRISLLRLTEASLAPKAAMAHGMPFPKFLDVQVELAMAKKRFDAGSSQNPTLV